MERPPTARATRRSAHAAPEPRRAAGPDAGERGCAQAPQTPLSPASSLTRSHASASGRFSGLQITGRLWAEWWALRALSADLRRPLATTSEARRVRQRVCAASASGTLSCAGALSVREAVAATASASAASAPREEGSELGVGGSASQSLTLGVASEVLRIERGQLRHRHASLHHSPCVPRAPLRTSTGRARASRATVGAAMARQRQARRPPRPRPRRRQRGRAKGRRCCHCRHCRCRRPACHARCVCPARALRCPPDCCCPCRTRAGAQRAAVRPSRSARQPSLRARPARRQWAAR
jgi:hypothetical protein